jgi:hypothetical protein
MGPEVYESIQEIPGVEISIRDRAKEDATLPVINERHKEFLNSRRPMGMGGPSFFWEGLDVLQHGVVITAHYLWPWFLKHFAGDVDSKAWDALKDTIKRIIGHVLSKKTGPQNDLVLRTFDVVNMHHGVTFIFPGDLEENEVDHALNLLQTASDLLKPEREGPSNTILRFDKAERAWQRI